MNLKNNLYRAALFCLFMTSLSLFGQDIFSANQDLSKILVEDLSETDLNKIRSEMKARKLKLEDLQTMTSAKGMSPIQFSILSERLKTDVQQEISNSDKTQNNIKKEQVIIEQSEKYKKIFGSEIFANKQLNFEPNQSLATPGGYVLGPGDELEIILFGMQQFQQTARISKEGLVSIPNVGNIKVGGLQFGAALELLKKKCATIYSSLKSGASELSVSLTDFKTIQITIIGAQNPGNYNVSSLATVFNALHAAGGPGENGSFRNIELIRKGKLIKSIDLYSFLSKGDISGNLNLQNDDIIRVPAYSKRVEIEGEVKRPGIYELKENENFKDLLSFCSGFTENAFEGIVTITRLSERKKKIVTFEKSAFDTLRLESGDIVKIDQILDLYENRIQIKGAVNHPGAYELSIGMRISDLIRKSDGFREDAYLSRALLVRQQSNMLKEAVGINLQEISANPGSVNDLILQKEDELIVPSAFDFEEERVVEINGEILNSGQYPYFRKMKLFDLIIQAGGLKESSSDIVEVSRIINSDSIGIKVDSRIINLKISKDFSNEAENIELRPFDVVSIRKKTNYKLVNTVTLAGAVVYPGKYGIGDKNERVGNLIERAGGINNEANLEGVKIIRIIEFADQLDSMRVKRRQIIVPVAFKKISGRPNHRSNVILEPGDSIVVEHLSYTVKMIGEVEMNSEISIKPGKRAKYYINSSGGFKENADKKLVYVIFANGFTKKTRSFLFFKVYPKPKMGSQVVVTKKPEKQKMNTSEVVGISSVLSSVTGMTIALINLLK